MRILHVDVSNDLLRDGGGDPSLSPQEMEIARATIAQITEGIEALRGIARLRPGEEQPLTIFAGLDRQ